MKKIFACIGFISCISLGMQLELQEVSWRMRNDLRKLKNAIAAHRCSLSKLQQQEFDKAQEELDREHEKTNKEQSLKSHEKSEPEKLDKTQEKTGKEQSFKSHEKKVTKHLNNVSEQVDRINMDIFERNFLNLEGYFAIGKIHLQLAGEELTKYKENVKKITKIDIDSLSKL